MMTKCQVCESTEPMRLCANKSTEKVDVDECSRLLITEAKLTAAQDGLLSALEHIERDDTEITDLNAKLTAAQNPIDMLLWCPACGEQHIDKPDGAWTNPPHRSHLCNFCGCIWRPADVHTNGVATVKTRGKSDSPLPLNETLRKDVDAAKEKS